MRQGGILADLHVGVALEAQLPMRLLNQRSNVVLGHALMESLVCGFVCGERDFRGQSHEVYFMRRLDHAASGSDERGVDYLCLWRRLCDPAAENVTDSFFHGQRPGCDSPVAQSLGNALVWTLVFLPGSEVNSLAVGSERKLFPCAAFLESRADVERAVLRRQYHC